MKTGAYTEPCPPEGGTGPVVTPEAVGCLFRPRRRDLAAIAAAALALRLIVAVLSMYRVGATPEEFAHFRDGRSYIRVAQAMRGYGDDLRLFDMRVFPGYPALIAGANAIGLDYHWGALLLNWAGAALAAALAAVLFADCRIGWAMAVLTPSYLMYTSLAMSEATLMAFIGGGMALAAGGAWVAGGIFLGFAGLVRPVAAFAVAGFLTWALGRGRHMAAVCVGLAALAVVAAPVVATVVQGGDALEGLRIYAGDSRAYDGEPLTWPFKSLVMVPLRQQPTLWKVAYIYAHVVVTLAGCILAALRFRVKPSAKPSRADMLAAAAPVWLWLNTLFCLSIGAHWGFQEFHRFMVPALPPLYWAFGRWLPVRWSYWGVIGAVSAVLAVWGATH